MLNVGFQPKCIFCRKSQVFSQKFINTHSLQRKMLNVHNINQQFKFEIIMIRQYRLWEIVDPIPIFHLISQLIHKELSVLSDKIV